MGCCLDYFPFEYSENKKLYGIDIEIIEEISKRTNIDFEFVEMDFKSILALDSQPPKLTFTA